jgi:hypothetical protein
MQITDTETGEVLDLAFGDSGTAEKEAFRIDSLEKCEWYLLKINSLASAEGRLKENFEKRLHQIQQEEKNLKLRFEQEFLEEIKKHIPRGKKSLTTLSGTIQFRKTKPKVEIDEKHSIPEKFWKKEEKIIETIDKEALLKAFENGESPDGARYLPERDTYTIK